MKAEPMPKRGAMSKQAFGDLQTIPGIGPKIAKILWEIGVRSTTDLKGQDPEKLYRRLCEQAGGHVDRCVLYVMRSTVYYASSTDHDPEKLKWWNWKD